MVGTFSFPFPPFPPPATVVDAALVDAAIGVAPVDAAPRLGVYTLGREESGWDLGKNVGHDSEGWRKRGVHVGPNGEVGMSRIASETYDL